MEDRSKPSPGLDISTPASRSFLRSNEVWVFLGSLLTISFLLIEGQDSQKPLKIALLVILVIFLSMFAVLECILLYFLVVHRGIWTWGRLANLPSKLYGQKNEPGAWRAFDQALTRARRFRRDDPRRAQMDGDLALFLSNQTHYAHADALFAEAVDIFKDSGIARIADLARVRNNWAVSRIDRLH